MSEPRGSKSITLGSTPGMCANCRKREGTIRWGDALAQTHGFVKMWCEVCALEVQVKHAEERAAKLPELRERLAKAKAQ